MDLCDDVGRSPLFLAVMALATHVSRLQLGDLAGIARRMPWTMGAFVIAGLSLIGVPGTAGFISKWYLLLAAAEEGLLGVGLIVVIAAGSLMAVVYVWRIVEVACFGGAAQDQSSRVSEAPAALLLGTWTVALANIGFGIYPDIPVALSRAAATSLLGHLP